MNFSNCAKISGEDAKALAALSSLPKLKRLLLLFAHCPRISDARLFGLARSAEVSLTLQTASMNARPQLRCRRLQPALRMCNLLYLHAKYSVKPLRKVQYALGKDKYIKYENA